MRLLLLSLLIGLLALSSAYALTFRPFVGGAVLWSRTTSPPGVVHEVSKQALEDPFSSAAGESQFGGELSAGLMSERLAVYIGFRSNQWISTSERREETYALGGNSVYSYSTFDHKWVADQITLGLRLFPFSGNFKRIEPVLGVGLTCLQIKRTRDDVYRVTPTATPYDRDLHWKQTVVQFAPLAELGVLIQTKSRFDVWLLGRLCAATRHVPQQSNSWYDQDATYYEFQQWTASLGVTYRLTPL